jgi:acetyltransferase-like isoleucine patch superfamily enzyme
MRHENGMAEGSGMIEGRWIDGTLPDNVQLGTNTVISNPDAFKRFRSRHPRALVIGTDCTLDGVQFALGERAQVEIGDFCYFSHVVLLSELHLQIGSCVMIGWNSTVADTDFHPLAPALRLADAVAVSPLGKGAPRPEIVRQPVIIGNDVWIGPSATILKGVRLGAGAFVEPGALVTRDVPARKRVAGNPAQVIGEV